MSTMQIFAFWLGEHRCDFVRQKIVSICGKYLSQRKKYGISKNKYAFKMDFR